MALGEYVSVSSQRDSEQTLLAKERRELEEDPAAELDELTDIYVSKGLSSATARAVAEELTAIDAFGAHVEVELGLDPNALTNPWHAALSSAVSFTVGSTLPILAIVLPGPTLRVPITFFAVLLALVATGSISATLGGSARRTAVTRVVVGGALAMIVTYAVGQLVGTTLS
jgi:VIT1/CCC1 family predicted Fe2+/Mn2+ transporter